MKQFLLALVVVMTLVQAQASRAQDGGAASEIQNVINRQMAAFAIDDFADAFTYAADSIQQMFGTSDNFGVMVKRGYPMVYRADDVRFGALRADGNALWQSVLVRDSAGVLHALDYLMVSDGEAWRIAAVQVLQPNGIGA